MKTRQDEPRRLAQKCHVNTFRVFFKSTHIEALRFKLPFAVCARVLPYSLAISGLLILSLFPMYF